MPKIMLQNTTDHHKIGCEFNRGGAAVVLSTVATLRKLIPGAEFTSFIQFSDSFSAQHDIKVVENKLFSIRLFSLAESLKSWWLFLRGALWVILRKYLHVNLSLLVDNRKLKQYHQADAIIDLSMDHFNGVSGIIPVLEISRDVLLGVLLGKPVAIYAQSVGPFKGWLASKVAKFALNRVSLITVRDKISRGYLEQMVVDKPPIYVTVDPAFLLEPAPEARVKEILSELRIDSNSKLLIGIGTPEGALLGGAQTWQGYKRVLRWAYYFFGYCFPEGLILWLMRLIKGSKYYTNLQSQHSGKTEESIAQIADHLVERMNASVLLVPHFVLPRERSQGEEDGRVVAEAIHRLASNKDKVIPITDEYTAQEIKGIIGQCDLFISMKMHPAIAATSQCVPTIVIGWGKLLGLMQMLGQERWVCDRFSVTEVTAKVDDAWIQREKIKKELESRQEALREKALLNAKLVKQLLDFAPEPDG